MNSLYNFERKMIGKQEKGRSFRGCLKYVLEKQGAQFLGGNMLGETVEELAAEFEAICRLNPRLEVAVYHAMLAVSAEERRTDEQWRAIVASYMRGMGFDNSQYIIVRHTDEEHDHVHIVASRVAIPDGKAVSDSNDYRRSEDLIRKLERTYELQPVASSYEQLDRAPTTGEVRKFEKQYQQYAQGIRANPPDPPIRLVLQMMVGQLSQGELTMPGLIEQLQERGVEVRVSLTEKQQWGISYSLGGQRYSGTQLGRAYTFQGLQKYKGIDYEPERDDARISAAICGQSRTSARSTANYAANDHSDSSDRGIDSGTEVTEAAIWGIDFVSSTFARATDDLGGESTEFQKLLDAIEEYIEQEAIGEIAGTIGEFSERFEQDCREPRETDKVRRGIEGVDRQFAEYFEQLSLEIAAAEVLETELAQWYGQVQQWSDRYNQYAFYGNGASSSEQRELAIAQAAFDDGLLEDEVFKLITCGEQADLLVQNQGIAQATQYLQNLVEMARFNQQLLLTQQRGYGLPQVSKQRQQNYYGSLPDQDAMSDDPAIMQQVYGESGNWNEAMAVVGAGHSARRVAYQQGIQAWADYLNDTVTQAHGLMQQEKLVSSSTTEDDAITLECDWGQRQWIAQPDQLQQAQEAIEHRQRELAIAQRAKELLDQELEAANQASMLEQLFQNKEELKGKKGRAERIKTKISTLQAELKQSRSTLNSYQASIEREETRLETIYTTLVQEVQDKLHLQDPRAIDQRVALEILRASPQPEDDLKALSHSSQLQLKQGSQSGEAQAQDYLDEVIKDARHIYWRSRAIKTLENWELAARALQRPYVSRIAEIIETFKREESLPEGIKATVEKDFSTHNSKLEELNGWYSNAQKLKKSSDYLLSIRHIKEQFQAGIPLTKQQTDALKTDREAASHLVRHQLEL
ncbi:relaxase/mobilization nuclease family protein (plasmid) [Leptolyngbya sp. NIES-3755]|nr:relaxase/mobilization nuclease family protein [Leptolyngbya sp. NIES-3755]